MTLRIVIVAILALIAEFKCFASDPAPPAPSGESAFAWGRLPDVPDAFGVAGAFAGVCGGEDGGQLVVAGGANFPDRPPWEGGAKALHATAWMLADPGSRWEPAPPLPEPRGYGVSATFGGRVWCVGGCDGKQHMASTVALGWDATMRRITVEADALPPLPKPVAYAAGVIVGSRLYIAGGQETPAATVALGTLWSIDLALAIAQRGDRAAAQPQWQEHPPCPGPPRILPALATHAGRVILVSGAALVPKAAAAGPAAPPSTTRRFLRDAYAFDPDTRAWTVLTPPPVPLVAAAGPAIPVGDGRLAFLPGDDGALFERRTELADQHPGFPRGIHLYDPATDSWLAGGEIPAAVAGTAVATPVTTPAVAWRSRIVIASGETKPGVRTPTVLTATTRRALPVDIIFDTDIGNDVDDVLALGLIHALESRGECRLLAVTITKDHPRAAAFTDAVNTFYQRGSVPIGVVSHGVTPDAGTYLPLAEARDAGMLRYPHDLEPGTAPDALRLLRQTLAARPDGSVVIVQVGFFTNLARLLDTTPDDVSSLSGTDLVRRKVRLLSVMGGRFKAGDGPGGEYNVVNDLPSARKLIAKWPTPTLWSGFEIGVAMPYPHASIEQDYGYTPHHPLAESYRLYMPPPHDRPTWDLTSVLAVVRPDGGYFGVSEPGIVSIDEAGLTTFSPAGDGRDRHLVATAGHAARAIAAFRELCAAPPDAP